MSQSVVVAVAGDPDGLEVDPSARSATIPATGPPPRLAHRLRPSGVTRWPTVAAVANTGWMNQQDRWFVEGAAALGRTLTTMGLLDHPLPIGQFYACPCCLTAYGRDALDRDVFTVDHVPPKAVGGRKLVLTCRACNSLAGSAFDAHAARREAQFDLFTGRGPGRAVRVDVAVGDTIIGGDIHRAGDSFIMVWAPTPKANSPMDVEEATRTMDGWAAAATGGRIRFRFSETLLPARAQLSWVRAGYLAAFAALGWRYAFLRLLNPLRAQLADPSADLLPPLAMVDPQAPRDCRQLIVVKQPDELRSLAVRMGRHTVFLPGLEQLQSFETLSAALARFSQLPAPRPQLVGKQIPWPAKPRYTLDR
jgi:hypothetical protein